MRVDTTFDGMHIDGSSPANAELRFRVDDVNKEVSFRITQANSQLYLEFKITEYQLQVIFNKLKERIDEKEKG